MALASSLNPSTVGASVTFTATVSGNSGAPAGTVDFRDGSAAIAGCSAVPVSGGKATCTTAALAQGTHAIAAQYSGSSAYNASSATVSQVVNAAAGPIEAAEMVYPANGMTLMGWLQPFDWTAVKGATYTLLVGSSPGANDIGILKPTNVKTSAWIVLGMPSDGRKVYVRLITKVGSATQTRDYQYVADSKNAVEMKSPTLLKRLKGTTQTFKWSEEKGASGFTLAIGTTLGGRDIAITAPTNANSVTVKNLPSNGDWIYVRLVWSSGGTTSFRDYAYLAYDPKARDDDKDHDRWGQDDDDDDDGKDKDKDKEKDKDKGNGRK
jgi:hypothetical protein